MKGRGKGRETGQGAVESLLHLLRGDGRPWLVTLSMSSDFDCLYIVKQIIAVNRKLYVDQPLNRHE